MTTKIKLWITGLILIVAGIIMVRIISPLLYQPVTVLTAYSGGLLLATIGLLVVSLAIRSKS